MHPVIQKKKKKFQPMRLYPPWQKIFLTSDLPTTKKKNKKQKKG